jgi:hypothetical protein
MSFSHLFCCLDVFILYQPYSQTEDVFMSRIFFVRADLFCAENTYLLGINVDYLCTFLNENLSSELNLR